MTNQEIRAQEKAYYEAPFRASQGGGPSMELTQMIRQTSALEYIAYQLGEMNQRERGKAAAASQR